MTGFMKFIVFLGAIMFLFLALLFLMALLIVVFYTIDCIKEKSKVKKAADKERK